jgi:hypothetical protein
MSPADRVVTVIPLQVLWTDDGELPAQRGRWLDRDAIRELLRKGPVRFVVANVGERLRWISLDDRFGFWKADVVAHLAETDRIRLDGFPDNMAYVASEWLSAENGPPIVLLETRH